VHAPAARGGSRHGHRSSTAENGRSRTDRNTDWQQRQALSDAAMLLEYPLVEVRFPALGGGDASGAR
jgi:hypothetical protein